ncbi:Leucine Rich repeat [Carpediemonas membranifera]|uniref:Leucine Rich repeat n=1 Tax=Carpediemonas membranifera TaxID=201153 RepID=A0A8J6BZ41_9EUKA|nr:Leucine Rich repeat [Carpediemonas membranifera]|eukprot:KAG9395166.1 Leucine Rich repeat [Carpediemonas membranifera]
MGSGRGSAPTSPKKIGSAHGTPRKGVGSAHNTPKTSVFSSADMKYRPHEIDTLFNAKCRDLGIKSLGPQLERFRYYMFAHCNKDEFNLVENHLGPQSAAVIAGILKVGDRPNTVTTLNLNGNQLGDAGVAKLVPLFNLEASKLSTILLRSNDIGPAGAVKLLNAIATSPVVATLDIGGISGVNRNHIGRDGSAALASCLETNTKLVTLDISANGIGPEGATELCAGVAANHTLQTLELSSNNLEQAGMSALAPGLAVTGLTKLGLAANQLGDSAASILATEVLAVNPSIEKIDLSANTITENGAGVLAEILKLPPAAEVTAKKRQIEQSQRFADEQRARIESNLPPALSHTLFDPQTPGTPGTPMSGASPGPTTPTTPIATAAALDFSGMCALTVLDLTGNKIGPHGAIAIFEALEMNQTLVELRVGKNGLTAQCVDAMSVALKGNHTLQVLDVSHNTLGDAGAEATGAALRTCPAIRTLDLSSNHISDRGALALADGIKTSYTLQNLNVADNSIGDDGGLALCDAATQSAGLISMGTKLNRMSYKTSMQIKDVMKGRSLEFKKGMADRVQVQVQRLQMTKQQLDEATHELESARKRRETTEGSFQCTVKEMEMMQAASEAEIAELEQCLDVAIEKKDVVAKDLQALNHEIGESKAYSASKLRMLAAKTQREAEAVRQIQKKVKNMQVAHKDVKTKLDVERSDVQRKLDVQTSQYNIMKSRLQRKQEEFDRRSGK